MFCSFYILNWSGTLYVLGPTYTLRPRICNFIHPQFRCHVVFVLIKKRDINQTVSNTYILIARLNTSRPRRGVASRPSAPPAWHVPGTASRASCLRYYMISISHWRVLVGRVCHQSGASYTIYERSSAAPSLLWPPQSLCRRQSYGSTRHVDATVAEAASSTTCWRIVYMSVLFVKFVTTTSSILRECHY